MVKYLLNKILWATVKGKVYRICNELGERGENSITYTHKSLTLETPLYFGQPKIYVKGVKVYDTVDSFSGWHGVPRSCKSKIINEIKYIFDLSCESRERRFIEKEEERQRKYAEIRRVCEESL